MSALLERIQRKDSSILLLFNNNMKCRILDFIMPFITYLGSFTFSVTLCVVCFFIPLDIAHSLAIKTASSLIISTVAVRSIKITVNRIRPFLTLENLNTKKIGIDNYSFPSGHTTSAFSIAIIFSLYFPIATPLLVTLACGVGISRMYFGVHYPTDVLVGMILGTICSYTVFLI
ncbi:MAG: phosphatase PAP2 family protein [Clostridiaceae bacterium]|nr:phosphatase PAP2 family protein [Clostridiaceae bacterium]